MTATTSNLCPAFVVGQAKPPAVPDLRDFGNGLLPEQRAMMTVMGVVAQSANVPDGLIECIAERFSPDKIILFGSCARGDAGPESDIDLLVLFREVADPHKRAAELYASLVDFPRATDVVVSTTSRFERYRDVVNTVYWPASREGKVLYERTA